MKAAHSGGGGGRPTAPAPAAAPSPAPGLAAARLTKELLACSIATGLIFSLSIFFGFVGFSWLPLPPFGNRDLESSLVSLATALAYLAVVPLDRRGKSAWFKALAPAALSGFAGLLVVQATGSFWGLVPVVALLVPAIFASSVTLSVPGYLSDVEFRGRVNSLTVLSLFTFVGAASWLSFALPSWGYGAGALFLGVAGVAVVVPLSVKLPGWGKLAPVIAPHRVRLKPSAEFADVKPYLVVLFLYKVALGMLFSVAYKVPESVSPPGLSWAVAGFTAAALAVPFGVLTDRVGRKFAFNVAVAGMAFTFGVLALTRQGEEGGWAAPVVLGCMVLVGASYSSVLVAEYSLFQDFSNDATRVRTVAVGLCVHVAGVSAGVMLGFLFANPGLSYFLLATNAMTAGLFVSSTAKEPLPDPEELLWRRSLRHLFVYVTDSGIGLVDYSFVEEEAAAADLVTGGLTGVSALISEVTRRDGSLTAIRQEDATILFRRGRHVTVALIAGRELKTLHEKLARFVDEFEEFFADLLVGFTGDVAAFAPGKVLVERAFG
ncbi:MAG: hypothetical protein Kow0069_38440 [Promethearchaeota archaeon]